MLIARPDIPDYILLSEEEEKRPGKGKEILVELRNFGDIIDLTKVAMLLYY